MNSLRFFQWKITVKEVERNKEKSSKKHSGKCFCFTTSEPKNNYMKLKQMLSFYFLIFSVVKTFLAKIVLIWWLLSKRLKQDYKHYKYLGMMGKGQLIQVLKRDLLSDCIWYLCSILAINRDIPALYLSRCRQSSTRSFVVFISYY